MLQSAYGKEKKDEETGVIDSCRKLGSTEDGGGFRGRCGIYRRRGIRAEGEGEELQQRGDGRGDSFCPCAWGESACHRQYPRP